MWIIEIAIGLGSALALVAAYLLTCIRVLNEYERGVIFRLGRAIPQPKGPGLILVFWPVDRMMRVDLRTITKVIEPQDRFLVRHFPGGLDYLAQHAGSGGTR